MVLEDFLWRLQVQDAPNHADHGTGHAGPHQLLGPWQFSSSKMIASLWRVLPAVRIFSPTRLLVFTRKMKMIQHPGLFATRLLSVAALALGASLTPADAQNSGKPFAARDPRTCASRKDGLSAAQAKQYVICDYEKVVQ